MDESDKSSDSVEIIDADTPETLSSDESSTNVKICVDCSTTRTTLWRTGPAGPKSLCYACGVKSRMTKNDVLGLNKNSIGVKQKTAAAEVIKAAEAIKAAVIKNRGSSSKSTEKLDEVEKAAAILMSLAWGSFD